MTEKARRTRDRKPPRSSCLMDPTAAGLRLYCPQCKAEVLLTLPATVDHILLRSQDFTNYHRWCNEPAVEEG